LEFAAEVYCQHAADFVRFEPLLCSAPRRDPTPKFDYSVELTFTFAFEVGPYRRRSEPHLAVSFPMSDQPITEESCGGPGSMLKHMQAFTRLPPGAAPEANHAVRGAIDEAPRCKEEGVSRTILFNLCGHGHFDMQAYIDYIAGRLEDRAYDEIQLAAASADLPRVAAK
jgi:hypothetical protein